jgi:hypothetical protein
MTPAASNSAATAPRASTRWRRRAGRAAAFAIVGIGLLHLPLAKGLLMRLGGCPFASASLTPAQMDTARHLALATRKGEASAPSRPALGFALDATSAGDVHRWADRSRVTCEDVHQGLITCANVPSEALGRPASEGRIDELALGFNQRGRLVNLTTMREHMEPRRASIVSSDIVSSLRESLGPAMHTAGALTASSLSTAGASGMATVSYRYSDYVAEIVAMNLPSSGLSVREHYVSSSD